MAEHRRSERSVTPENWEECYDPGEQTCDPLDARFFLLVKIIFDVMCPSLRRHFVTLWNRQNVNYGSWEKVKGSSKLSVAIGSNKHFKILSQPIKERICSADIDKFDATCLFKVILHLDLFTLDGTDRQALEKLEETRNLVLHSSCTQMTEPDFKQHTTNIKQTFSTLCWDTNELENLSEAKWCITDEEYVRLRRVHGEEKEQLEELKNEKLQSGQKLEDEDNVAIMQGGKPREEKNECHTEKSCKDKQEQNQRRSMSPGPVREQSKPTFSQGKDQSEMCTAVLHEMANQRKDRDHMFEMVMHTIANQTKVHGDMVQRMASEQSKQSEAFTNALADQQRQSGKMMEKMFDEMASQRKEQHAMSTTVMEVMANQCQQMLSMTSKRAPDPEEGVKFSEQLPVQRHNDLSTVNSFIQNSPVNKIVNYDKYIQSQGEKDIFIQSKTSNY